MGVAYSRPTQRLSGQDQVLQRQQPFDGMEDGDGVHELCLNIPFKVFADVRRLADGTACSCSRATYRGVPVVLKRLKETASAVHSKDFDRELSILQLLQHPNIVQLLGAGHLPQAGLFIVLQNLSRGTLSHVIGTDLPEGKGWIGRKMTRSMFPRQEAFRQGAGVASALAYMHNDALKGAKIVHRDIKSCNLAFAADGTLCLIDFGLAKILRPSDSLEDNLYKMTGDTGSLRYMPPEVARSFPSNEKADVYSFALILWEMVALELPFAWHSPQSMWDKVVLGGVRPRTQPDWPTEFVNLLQRCWSVDVHQRPDMVDVHQCLLNLAFVSDGS